MISAPAPDLIASWPAVPVIVSSVEVVSASSVITAFVVPPVTVNEEDKSPSVKIISSAPAVIVNALPARAASVATSMMT